MKVIVVGAGLAGLTSALALQDAGCEVIVVEAQDRVGGRVHTLRDGFANEQYADLGAELIYPAQIHIMELCHRMDLALTEPFDVENALPTLFLDGERLSMERAEALASDLSATIAKTPPQPFENVAAWAARARIPVAGCAVLRGVIQSTPAGPLRYSDARELDPRASWGTSIRKIFGGNDRLPAAMARRLDVRLGAAARRISHSAAGVAIECDSAALEADRLIVAVPGPLVLEIGFDPPLPPNKIEAELSMRYGGGVRIAAQYAEGVLIHAALRGGCFVSGWGGFVLDQSLHQAGETAVVTALLVGDGEPGLVNERELLAQLDAVVTELVGGTVTRLFGRVKSWTRDPYARALVRLPIGDQAERAIPVLAAPVGERLFFAGEHTDTRKAPGGMEGAIRSGRRAAAEVIAAA